MRPGHHWLCEFGDAGNDTSCEKEFNLSHRGLLVSSSRKCFLQHFRQLYVVACAHEAMCRRGTKNMHRKRHNKLALRQCWGTRRSAGRRPLRPCQTVLEFGAWGVETINENCLFDLQDVSFSNSSRSQRALIFGVYTQIRCHIFQCLRSQSERATSDGRTTEARES